MCNVHNIQILCKRVHLILNSSVCKLIQHFRFNFSALFRFTFYILDSCASLSFYIQSFASRGQNCLHSFIFLLLLQLTSKNRKMVDHSFAFTLQIIVEHKNLCKRTSMKLDKTLQCHTQPNNSIVFIFDECRSIYLTQQFFGTCAGVRALRKLGKFTLRFGCEQQEIEKLN